MEAQAGEASCQLLGGDEPIISAHQDELSRTPLAAMVGDELRHAPKGSSFVVAITGPWGTGKTSALNLVVESLGNDASPPRVVHLDPWLFSGSEQLVREFLTELSAQLAVKAKRGTALKKVADVLLSYAESLRHLDTLPGGSWLARGATAAKFLRRFTRPKEPPSTYRLKCQLHELLASSGLRIVVIVDDVDRLLPGEIREVMRLVRTLADFPNMAYLLAFDKARVEQALESEGAVSGRGFGRGYLEKIVQVQHELPAPTQEDLSRILFSRLAAALVDVETLPFEREDWTNIYHSVVRPLLLTVRDVKRYTNAVAAAVRLLGAEVSVVDILAMEAARLFLPDFFRLLASSCDLLTSPAPPVGFADRNDAELKRRVDTLIEAAGAQRDVATQFLQRVFPASARLLGGPYYGTDFLSGWIRERRVASPEVLNYYFEHQLARTALPTRMIRTLFESLTKPEELDEALSALRPEQLEHAISRLDDYDGKFSREAIESSIPVFLARYGELSDEAPGMTLRSPRLRMSGLVYRMVKSIEDESRRRDLVHAVLPRIDTLSARLELVRIVGHDENAGHKLVTLEDAETFEHEVLAQIFEADTVSLRNEPEIKNLARFIRNRDPHGADEWVTVKFSDDLLFMYLLEQSISEVHSQTVGSYAVRSSTQLQWDYLAWLLGEDFLKRRIAEIAASGTAAQLNHEAQGTIDLAQKYASGWRPPARF